MTTLLYPRSIAAGVALAALALLSLAAVQEQEGRQQMVWTLDANGAPATRVTLRETGPDEWQPVLWTSYHPNGKKRSEGVNKAGERVAGTWHYWDAAGKPVDRAKELEAMTKAIAELMAKPEHDAENIKVQHILISFQGAPRMTNVTRSMAEAEELAADLYAQIKGGADFDALVKAHTNDAHPGIYPLSKDSRAQMVAGFGDVGWRLAVGEVGVSPHDPHKSPFGWHIIKRLE